MTNIYDIYFNSKKEAFAYEIENPICIIKSDVWEKYAGTDKWDIVDGKFIDITDTEEYKVKILAEAKTLKYAENDSKAEVARTSKTFILELQEKECEFDTKTQTQTDLLTAFAVCSQGLTYDGWVCNNGVEIDLTLEDVTTVSTKFKELSNVYPQWNYFKKLIDEATTAEEVEAIVIDYNAEVGE